MKKLLLAILLCFSAFGLVNCSSNSGSSAVSVPKGEYLYRHHNEELFTIDPMLAVEREDYPWEEDRGSVHPKITKEFFRCKGSGLNPLRIVQRGAESVNYYDCGGAQRHSLPLSNGKEFIYPILIDLLNYVQMKTGKRVVITCGHCCPDHNMYLDPSPGNQATKHLIGAEVDFYVQEMEMDPEAIVDLLQQYYQEQPKYKGLGEYTAFKRYEGEIRNVSIVPWYNKEIFIKLVKKWRGVILTIGIPMPISRCKCDMIGKCKRGLIIHGIKHFAISIVGSDFLLTKTLEWLYFWLQCRCGEMVDAVDSKSTSSNRVLVRVRSSAF